MNILCIISTLLNLICSPPEQDIQEPLTESTYFDFGLSFGSNIWPYVDWSQSPAVINETKLNAYLASLFTQMKSAGQETVYLAFSQLDNIDVYASGNYEAEGIDAQYDVIAQLLNQFQKYDIILPGYPNFLDYLIKTAHQNEMKIAMAFGGQIATDACYKVLQKDEETYAGQAQKLADFANSYGVDRLDFDIEDPTALSSQPVDQTGDSVIDFFQMLHHLLTAEGKTMTLTSMLSLADWPNGALKPLFYNEAGEKIFAQLFDGLNMMGYSDTQYWLDPNNISWGIEQWLDIIGKENATLMHIGFNDGVPYSEPSANGGTYHYTIQSGSRNGQAAAQIYQQLIQVLTDDGYTVPLGNPFFWPAAAVTPNGKNRYSMENEQSNFVSQDMQDFYDWLRP